MMPQEIVEKFRDVANGPGPVLVATDLDGTLAPIVDRASEARVPSGTLAVLDRLATVARVAIITGRDLNTARRLVPCEGVIVIGSHGLEATMDESLITEVDRPKLAAALELSEQQVITAVPSAYLHIERKSISTAFHYRRAPELEAALREALKKLPKGLRLREGRMVLEVVPDAEGGKDRALAALAKNVRAKSVLTMGDDATDVAMFKTAQDLRKAGTKVLIAGIASGRETPKDIEVLADVMLASTEEALEGLEVVARSLGA